ncbi:putative membrane protein [Mycobacterium liflandii 128FXT]|uniref:Membrane protein n=1 Tax=Mycobacterium liflandii (strain 128FXT) TaxID=459424 RepID=L7UZB6_MYCL1|nr:MULTISPECIES: hypothetical protein [Mycobacterium ulcerans group]AGC60796.1 putative membrane protein [Mycobacterium liflandii 128FXT]RFZ61461.1 hypothetical protein BB170200_02104 [Mycobacterium marinum]ULL09337.1 hypothetical protein CKW46_06015 [Mycobacterium liflandii]
MTHRQLYLGIAGVVVGIIGLFALWLPVYLDHYDLYGMKVSCGRGFTSDLTQATQGGGGPLVDQCDSALLFRRAWAIPAVAIGWLLVTAFLVSWVHHGQREEQLS